MSEAIKIISVLIMAIAMLTFAYLFYLNGETYVVLVLLFIGIVLALSLTKGIIEPKKKR